MISPKIKILLVCIWGKAMRVMLPMSKLMADTCLLFGGIIRVSGSMIWRMLFRKMMIGFVILITWLCIS